MDLTQKKLEIQVQIITTDKLGPSIAVLVDLWAPQKIQNFVLMPNAS